MMYTWEEGDVIPGRRVDAHNRTERYIIGYEVVSSKTEPQWHLVSLRDGMIAPIEPQTKQDFTEHLNTLGMLPTDVRDEDMLPLAEITK
jgi:hypothetical protein